MTRPKDENEKKKKEKQVEIQVGKLIRKKKEKKRKKKTKFRNSAKSSKYGKLKIDKSIYTPPQKKMQNCFFIELTFLKMAFNIFFADRSIACI